MKKIWTTVVVVAVVAIIFFMAGNAYGKRRAEKNLVGAGDYDEDEE